MDISKATIEKHVLDVLVKISQAIEPDEFDFENSLLESGCQAALAEILDDYIPSAFGQVFLHELGIVPSGTYQRCMLNGDFSSETTYTDDGIWKLVEPIALKMSLSQETRKVFALVASHSAESDAVVNAVNAGQKLEQLKGSVFTSKYLAPLKHSNWPDQ